MAGKAINFDRRIGMAALTELPFGINAYRVATGILLCMAINTLDQTKRLTTNAFNDRFIALMIQQRHVLATHNICICHTLITLAGRRNKRQLRQN